MSIQVIILSNLMEDNNYPYKLKKELTEFIPLDKLSGLTESKLYYHFDALAKQGLIEIVEVIKEEHRPDKQVFGITAKGREELPRKIYQLFEKATTASEMLAGLSNLKYVDREKIVDILERKIDMIQTDWQKTKELGKRVRQEAKNQTLLTFVSGYFSTRTEHTIYWMKELIELIKRGEI